MQLSASGEATESLAARDAYDRFAFAYDIFTAGYAYERWFAALADLAAAHGFTGGRVLDVACGTGKSSLPWRSAAATSRPATSRRRCSNGRA